MRKKSFTIIEVIVSLAVVGIMVTIGTPVYQNFFENSKAKVCETNLKALHDALEIYSLENDSLPASLSELPHKYIREAYQHILKQKGAWKIELAYLVIDWREHGVAHAYFLKDTLAKGQLSIITCPSDDNPPSKGGISYGLNKKLENMDFRTYKDLPGLTLLIGDCRKAVFASGGELEKRHKKNKALKTQKYFQAITKDGTIVNDDTTPPPPPPTTPPTSPPTSPPTTPPTSPPTSPPTTSPPTTPPTTTKPPSTTPPPTTKPPTTTPPPPTKPPTTTPPPTTKPPTTTPPPTTKPPTTTPPPTTPPPTTAPPKPGDCPPGFHSHVCPNYCFTHGNHVAGNQYPDRYSCEAACASLCF